MTKKKKKKLDNCWRDMILEMSEKIGKHSGLAHPVSPARVGWCLRPARGMKWGIVLGASSLWLAWDDKTVC